MIILNLMKICCLILRLLGDGVQKHTRYHGPVFPERNNWSTSTSFSCSMHLTYFQGYFLGYAPITFNFPSLNSQHSNFFLSSNDFPVLIYLQFSLIYFQFYKWFLCVKPTLDSSYISCRTTFHIYCTRTLIALMCISNVAFWHTKYNDCLWNKLSTVAFVSNMGVRRYEWTAM